MTFNRLTRYVILEGDFIITMNWKHSQLTPASQKYKQMTADKVPKTDPEYQKVWGLLAALQKHKAFKEQKQQQMKLAQQQQMQQQQQQLQQQLKTNGEAATNGINGQCSIRIHSSIFTNAHQGSETTNGEDSKPQTLMNGASGGPTPVPQEHQPKPDLKQTASSILSLEQQELLRNQMFAFKNLSSNAPIPPTVREKIFRSYQPKDEQPTTVAEAVSSAAQVIEEASKPQSTTKKSLPVISRRTHEYKTFTDPHTYLRRSIGYAEHSRREGRPFIPALFPVGVEIDRVREERERISFNRIMARKAELEAMSIDQFVWNTRTSDDVIPNDSLKLKALIEYKKLCLLPKQRALREKVGREVMQYDNLAQTANRYLYRKTKRPATNEAKMTEKLEKQQRDARKTKEKSKQEDFLRSIRIRRDELLSHGRQRKERASRSSRSILQLHQSIEKEEQKRIERTAKQRLQALKANDEETYLKLLGQAKDSRISHLLKQTDGFLGQLAASVKQQQRTAAERYGNEEDLPEEDESEVEDDEEGGPKVDYYQVAHRIKEEVLEQPKILVGGSLKEYQLKGLQWMISLYNNNLNGILADEMGLGKTIQTISLVCYLIEKKRQMGPFLVIVPLSTLTNWNMEFEKWAPSVSRIVYKGNPNQRKLQQYQIRQGNFQVLLTTYEYIIKDRPLLCKIKWVHMIVDEGHRMKNANSKLSSTLTQYYHARYRLILTGTPLQNNLPELWALLNFALPAIFKSVKSFDEWFNTPFANTGGQDKMELTEEEQLLVIRRLHKVLRPFLLRRLKKDVEKDLPDKLERVIKCKFSALQAKLYKQLVNNNRIAMTDGKGGKTGMRGLSNMLMQLRKLCNHPFVFEPVEDQMNPERISNDLLWRTAGKFELLDRILPKFKVSGHRVLMFFQMTQIMNIMEDFLRLRGMHFLRLDGSTKSDDRSELLRLFNAPGSEYFCFLLSTRAGGLGLNLQTADTVIIYDSDWNPHQDLQAQDRAHRIGQKNEVRILRLISSNSVEEKILERANFKKDMDGKVIQAGKFDNKSTAEERDALLRTLLDTEAVDALTEQDEMDDDDLNEIMARSEDELKLFNEIDAERSRDPDYGPGKSLPRLMGENELPDIYLQEDNPIPEEMEEIAGRGARERTRVKYDDGLTEEQWLMAVDDEDDTIEAAIARKNARIDKRNSNKEKRAGRKSGFDSSAEVSRESSEVPVSRKKGRGGKMNGAKRKADDDADETPVAKRKRGGKPTKTQDTLSAGERNLLQKILTKTYNHLMHYQVEVAPTSSDEEGDSPAVRNIIGPFMKLVPKMSYPDYYIIIQNPIAMDHIDKKIKKEQYQGLREFMDDVKLLCNNARTYNEDGSMLFQDANDIEVGFADLCREDKNKTYIIYRLPYETN